MIPVDARLANNFDIEDEAIALDRIITATQPAKKLRLIILDACRDNPFVHMAEHAAETRGFQRTGQRAAERHRHVDRLRGQGGFGLL